MTHRLLLTALLLVASWTARAVSPEAAQKLLKDAAPALVAVQYTYDGELGRREFVGAGLVVSEEGLVMTSIMFTPQLLPDEQMKDFKILLPGDDQVEIDAEFVGRDERSNVSFVRPKAGKSAEGDEKAGARKWTPVKFEDVPVSVGDEILSVGMLGKNASYQTYFAHAVVAANLRGETRHVLVTGEGLTSVGSPVFNAAGKAVGWVNMQQGQGVTLNDPNPENQMRGVFMPPRLFVPTKEFAISLADPPVPGKFKLPWLGVAQMIGLKKEVAEYYGLKGQTAVQVGDVIQDTPADKAGLKPGTIVVKFNGEPLERGDEPDEAALILMKNVKRMKVGDTVTLSVLSEPNKPPTDVKITLGERPKQESQAKRFYAEDLGFTTREVVFDDTYRRKLPADQKGVVVALVKPSSLAASGKLERGDLVTKLNQTPVTDIEQFTAAYQEFRKSKPKEAIVLEAIRNNNDEIIRIEPPQ